MLYESCFYNYETSTSQGIRKGEKLPYFTKGKLSQEEIK